MRKIIFILGLIIGVSAFSTSYGYGQACKGVSAGESHTCILTSDGNVDCYGDNFAGRAEDYTKGDAVGVSAGESHTCVLTSDGNVDCYGNNSDGQAEDYGSGDAIGIAAGGKHTCVLTSGGNVDCYGSISNGRSEDYTKGDAVGVSAGWNHTCILTSDGNVDCYGDNFAGRAEDYTKGDAVGVSAGWYHTCILTSDGNVDCYGDNFAGRAEDYTGGDALCSVSPVPDIKANGSDGPVTVSSGDPFTVTGQLNTGGMSGQNADWWVGVYPFSEWYHYDLTSGWMPGETPTYQGPLFDLSPTDVPGMFGLPAGTYTFYFAVDMVMNGLLDMDQIYYDSVQVTIEP